MSTHREGRLLVNPPSQQERLEPLGLLNRIINGLINNCSLHLTWSTIESIPVYSPSHNFCYKKVSLLLWISPVLSSQSWYFQIVLVYGRCFIFRFCLWILLKFVHVLIINFFPMLLFMGDDLDFFFFLTRRWFRFMLVDFISVCSFIDFVSICYFYWFCFDSSLFDNLPYVCPFACCSFSRVLDQRFTKKYKNINGHWLMWTWDSTTLLVIK